MRRNCLLSSTILIWCLTLFISCNKATSDPPEIRFILPLTTTVLGANHLLQVEIDIWDDILIEEYEFELQSGSGFELYHEDLRINKESHKIEYQFDLSGNTATAYIISIKVKDSDGNKSNSVQEIAAN